jgi:hypothetical protein
VSHQCVLIVLALFSCSAQWFQAIRISGSLLRLETIFSHSMNWIMSKPAPVSIPWHLYGGQRRANSLDTIALVLFAWLAVLFRQSVPPAPETAKCDML